MLVLVIFMRANHKFVIENLICGRGAGRRKRRREGKERRKKRGERERWNRVWVESGVKREGRRERKSEQAQSALFFSFALLASFALRLPHGIDQMTWAWHVSFTSSLLGLIKIYCHVCVARGAASAEECPLLQHLLVEPVGDTQQAN